MFFKNSRTLFEISKLLLILLFTYASVSKLMDLNQFEAQLRQVPVLRNVAQAISLLLPILELLTAFFLVFERTLFAGLMVSAILMTGFTIYIAAMLLFSRNLPCSCGGVIAQMSWKAHLVFDLFFMLMSWNALINYYNSPDRSY